MVAFKDLELPVKMAAIAELVKQGIIPPYTFEKGIVKTQQGVYKKAITPKQLEEFGQAYFGKTAVWADHDNFISGQEIIDTITEHEALILGGRLATFTAFDTIEEFIEDHLGKHDYQITSRNTLTRSNSISDLNAIDEADLLSEIKTAARNYNCTIPKGLDGKPIANKIERDALADAMGTVKNRLQWKRIESRQRAVLYNPGTPAGALDDAVRLILESYWGYDYSQELGFSVNAEVLKHALWSIKRRVLNLPVELDMFYSLYSREGEIGKSCLWRDLSPDPEVYSLGSLRELDDINAYYSMAKKMNLINFDELAIDDNQISERGVVKKGSLANFKKIVTEEFIRVRGFHTQKMVEIPKTVVLGSTSNFPLWQLIQDPTGMRRFFCIEFLAPKDAKFLRRFLEAFVWTKNPHGLYQMIDESNERGYIHPDAPAYREVRKIQENYQKMNPLTLFLDTVGLGFIEKPDLMNPQKGYIAKQAAELYEDFRDWLHSRGQHKWAHPTIEAVIIEQGHSIVKKKGGLDFYHMVRL